MTFNSKGIFKTHHINNLFSFSYLKLTGMGFQSNFFAAGNRQKFLEFCSNTSCFRLTGSWQIHSNIFCISFLYFSQIRWDILTYNYSTHKLSSLPIQIFGGISHWSFSKQTHNIYIFSKLITFDNPAQNVLLFLQLFNRCVSLHWYDLKSSHQFKFDWAKKWLYAVILT